MSEISTDTVLFTMEGDLKINSDDAEAKMKELKEGFGDITDLANENMPNLTSLLQSGMEATLRTVDQLGARVTKVMQSIQKGMEVSADEIADINEQYRTIRSQQRFANDYNKEYNRVHVARKMKAYDAQTQREMDKYIPNVVSAAKDYAFSGRHGAPSNARELGQLLFNSSGEYNNIISRAPGQFSNALLNEISAQVLGVYRDKSWRNQRYGEKAQRAARVEDINDIPVSPSAKKMFLNSIKRGSMAYDLSSNEDRYLARSSYDTLRSLLSNNNMAAAAAVESGLATRVNDRLTLRGGLKETDIRAGLLPALYKNIINRASSSDIINPLTKKSDYIDFYALGNQDYISKHPQARKAFANRLLSGTAGRGVSAMEDILGLIENGESWTQENPNIANQQIYEGKKLLTQFTTYTHRPFIGKDPIISRINQSQATDWLGRGQWKNNDNVSGVVQMMSLEGFDKNNPEHKAYIEDLFANGKMINGKKYIAQSTHGMGDAAGIRMIEEGEMNRVRREKEKEYKKLGFRGNIWEMMEDQQLQELYERGGLEFGNLGKHYDAENKIWTDSYDLGLNFNGRKVGIIDMSKMTDGQKQKFADGTGWAVEDLLPHAIQDRGALGIKGTIYPVKANKLGDMFKALGFGDSKGRVMLPGVNGMFDASDYDMLLDVSQVKNLLAYANADGSMPTSRKANKMITGLMQHEGLRAKTDFDVADHDQSALGRQAMSFLRMNPAAFLEQYQHGLEIVHQLQNGDINAIRKYVFPNADEDAIARKIHDPKIGEQFLTHSGVQSRIQSAIQGINNQMLLGAFDTFKGGSMPVLPLGTTPWQALIETNGGKVPKKTIQAVRDMYAKAGQDPIDAGKDNGLYSEKAIADRELYRDIAQNYTDEQIASLLTVADDEVIDFFNENSDVVSYTRDPSGYGNFALMKKNKARLLRPVYDNDRYKLSKTGVVFSQHTLDKELQSADLDADTVHSIPDIKLQKEIAAGLGPVIEANGSPVKSTLPEGVEVKPNALLRAVAAMLNHEATQGIGASAAGVRAMQANFDTINPEDSPFIQGLAIMAEDQNVNTTSGKKAVVAETSKSPQAMQIMLLQKEYGKYAKAVQEAVSDTRNFGALGIGEDGQLVFNEDDPNRSSNLADIDPDDIFRASNGEFINMKPLRELGIDRVNMPSVYMGNVVGGLLGTIAARATGALNAPRFEALKEALVADNGIGYGNYQQGTATYDLLKSNRTMLGQYSAGERFLITPEEQEYMRSLMAEVRTEIEQEANEKRLIGSERNKFIAQELKNRGYVVAEQALDKWGITTERANQAYPDLLDGVDAVNAPGTSIRPEGWTYNPYEASRRKPTTKKPDTQTQPTEPVKTEEPKIPSKEEQKEQSNEEPKKAQPVAPKQEEPKTATAPLPEPPKPLTDDEMQRIMQYLAAKTALSPVNIKDDTPEHLLSVAKSQQAIDKIRGKAGSIIPPELTEDYINAGRLEGKNLVYTQEDLNYIKAINDGNRTYNDSMLEDAAAKYHAWRLKYKDTAIPSYADIPDISSNPPGNGGGPGGPTPPNNGGGSTPPGNGGGPSGADILAQLIQGIIQGQDKANTLKSFSDFIDKSVSEFGRDIIKNKDKDATPADQYFGMSRWKVAHANDIFNELDKNGLLGEQGSQIREAAQTALKTLKITQNEAGRKWALMQTENALENLASDTEADASYMKQLRILDNKQETVRNARSAFEHAKLDAGYVKQEDGTWKEPRILTDSQREDLGLMEANLLNIENISQEQQDKIKGQLNRSIAADVSQLVHQANLDSSGVVGKVDKNVLSFMEQQQGVIGNITELQKKGVISEDLAKQLTDDINGIDLDQYRENLTRDYSKGQRKTFKQLDTALTKKDPIEQIDNYYNDLSERISEFVQQRQADIDEFTKELNKPETQKNAKRRDFYERQIKQAQEEIDRFNNSDEDIKAMREKEQADKAFEIKQRNQQHDIDLLNKGNLKDEQDRYAELQKAKDRQAYQKQIQDERKRIQENKHRLTDQERAFMNKSEEELMNEYDAAQDERDRDRLLARSLSDRELLSRFSVSPVSTLDLNKQKLKNQLQSRIDAINKKAEADRTADEIALLNLTPEQIDAKVEEEAARRYSDYADRALLNTRGHNVRYSRNRFASHIQQRRQDYLQTQITNRDYIAQRDKMQADLANMTPNTKAYTQQQEAINNMNKAIQDNQKILDGYGQNGAGTTVAGVFDTISEAANRLVMRLGRRVFQKALRETVQFVKQFDAQMTEIQMISMKSDEEMENVRSKTINKALNLRTSVSNVTTTEAALYRQGLSDKEVSQRTDSIIKFATVAGIKTQEATKIVTTALQNDMVASCEQAMDALVALGDNAATTASEISKGFQKAAATAKVAGVSYAELTTLLTIGTSKTQLSGTQIGTALNTIMTRMRKVSTSNFVADQNGETTTLNDMEIALRSVGIELRKDNQTFKTAYEVLYELSTVWESLSDIQKSVVTNAVAGTRQTNIFSTLMEGMSEDGGETVRKYLELVEGSEGITDKKYDMYAQSLAASLDTLRTSFDALIASFNTNGGLKSAINGLSELLQLMASANEATDGATGLVTVLAALVGVIGGSFIGGPAGSLIFGAASAIAAGGILGTIFGTTDNKTQKEKDYEGMKAYNAVHTDYSNNIKTRIADVRKLGEEYDKLTGAEKEAAGVKLQNALLDLATAFPSLSGVVLDAIKDINNWEEAVNNAENTAKGIIKENGVITGQNVKAFARKYDEDTYGENVEHHAINFDDVISDIPFTYVVQNKNIKPSDITAEGKQYAFNLMDNNTNLSEFELLNWMIASGQLTDDQAAYYMNWYKVLSDYGEDEVDNAMMFGYNPSSNAGFDPVKYVSMAAGNFIDEYGGLKATEYLPVLSSLDDISEIKTFKDSEGYKKSTRVYSKEKWDQSATATTIKGILKQDYDSNGELYSLWGYESFDDFWEDARNNFQGVKAREKYTGDLGVANRLNSIFTKGAFQDALKEQAADMESEEIEDYIYEIADILTTDDWMLPLAEEATGGEIQLAMRRVADAARKNATDENGVFNREQFLKEMFGWIDDITYGNYTPDQLVKDFLLPEDYDYYVQNGENKTGFRTKEDALKFAQKNGLSAADVFNKSGTNAFQSVSQITSAWGQNYASEKNTYGAALNEWYNDVKSLGYEEAADLWSSEGKAETLAQVFANNQSAGLNTVLFDEAMKGEGYTFTEDMYKNMLNQDMSGRKTSSYLDFVSENLFDDINEGIFNENFLESLFTKPEYQHLVQTMTEMWGEEYVQFLRSMYADPDNVSFEDRETAEASLQSHKAVQTVKDSFVNSANFEDIESSITKLTSANQETVYGEITSQTGNVLNQQKLNAAWRRVQNGHGHKQDYDLLYNATGLNKTLIDNAVANKNTGYIDSVIKNKASNTDEIVKASISGFAAMNDAKYEDLFDENGNLLSTDDLTSLVGQSGVDYINAIQAYGSVITKNGIKWSNNEGLQNAAEILDNAAKNSKSLNYKELAKIYSQQETFGAAQVGIDLSMNKENLLSAIEENAEQLNGMQNLGASTGDVSSYFQRLYEGRTGTLSERYGWLMDKMFGDNWQNGEFDMKNAKTIYDNAEPAGQAIIHEMFKTFGNEDLWMKAMRGEDVDLDEATKAVMKTLTEEGFTGLRNAAERSSVVSAFETGTASDQLGIMSGWLNTQGSIANATQALLRINSGSIRNEDYGAIGSALNLDASTVKKLMKTSSGKKLIEDSLKDAGDDLGTIMADVVKGVLNKDSLEGMDVSTLADALDGVNEGLASWVRTAVASVTEAGDLILNADQDLGAASIEDILSEANGEYMRGSAANRIARSILGYTFIPEPTRTLEEHLEAGKNYGVYNEQEAQDYFTGSNGLMNTYMYQRYISDPSMYGPMYQEYLNGQMYGYGTPFDLWGLMGSNMFGSGYFSENGLNLTAENMGSIRTNMIQNMSSQFGEQENQMLGQEFEHYVSLVQAINEGDFEGAAKEAALFNAEFDRKKQENLHRYGEYSDDIANSIKQWTGSTRDQAQAQKNLNQAIQQGNDAQHIANKFAKGARNLSEVSGLTGIGVNTLKGMSDEDIKKQIDLQLELNKTDVSNQLTGQLAAAVADIDTSGGITVPGNLDINVEGGVQMNADQLIALASENGWAQVQAAAEAAAAQGAEVVYTVEGTGDGVKIEGHVVSFNGSKGGGGGGGGGGKSAIQKWLEDRKHEDQLWDHQLKMAQLAETKYGNAGELTNQNKAYRNEIDLRTRRNKYIEKELKAVREKMGEVAKGSDDWFSLRDRLLSLEEALEENKNSIDELNKSIKENRNKINQQKSAIEQDILGVIEANIQKQRDMLDGRVTMEDTILNAIKARYQAEWDLIKKDIEKKREALEKEKSLINERLQARKESEDEAKKYEELAEYQRQLAMISMDSTRTKDAAELRKKIEDLQKEIGWDIAEKEADTQQQSIQDQIDAYDTYVETGDEDLNNFLADANNFAGEVEKVMSMSQDKMFAWLKANCEDYKNALEDTQLQMVNTWTDTFKQMKGITDTYWKEIAKIMTSKESFINFMKTSDEYKNASAAEKATMIYDWSLSWDNWQAAIKSSSVPAHKDKGLGETGGGGSGGGGGGGGGGGNKDETVTWAQVQAAKAALDEQKAKVKAAQDAYNNAIKELQDAISKNLSTTYIKQCQDLIAESKKILDQELQKQTALQAAYDSVRSKWGAQNPTTGPKPPTGTNTPAKYKTGGLVDYTGMAWVDGTARKPEAFLNADDTALIRQMLDEAKYVKQAPFRSNIDSRSFMANSGFRDVYITLNEAKLENDADYEMVARKVGEVFVKELNNQGMHTAVYSF